MLKRLGPRFLGQTLAFADLLKGSFADSRRCVCVPGAGRGALNKACNAVLRCA